MHRPLMISALLCGLAATPALAGPVSIGFEGPGNGPAPADMSEDGFTVAAVNMAISSPQKSGDGTDGPNEIERRANTNGHLVITRPGAPFQFLSLDWQAENANPSILVEGYFGSDLLATDEFTAHDRDGASGFITFHAEALAGLMLDRLVIRPQRDYLGAGALDAVVLDDASAGLSQLSHATGQTIPGFGSTCRAGRGPRKLSQPLISDGA